MGCTVREKQIRSNRRSRLVGPESDQSATANVNGDVGKPANVTSDFKPLHQQTLSQTPNPNLGVDGGWGYCTEEQLEDIFLKNLEFLYNEAINKLVALGYDEGVALAAIFRNGHFYGGMDVLTNILHNSLAYLNNDAGKEGNCEDTEAVEFLNLRQLEEYSLAGMVYLLQQVKTHLSRRDAMWCLLTSDLHVGRASVMEVAGNGPESGLVSGATEISNGGVSSAGPLVMSPALCRFHGGWGFGNSFPGNEFLPCGSEMALQREIEWPKRFDLSPSMKSLLKRNVAMFAAGFRAKSKQVHSHSEACPSSLSAGDSLTGCGTLVGTLAGHSDESQHEKNQDVANLMSKFRDFNLKENTESVSMDQKDEMILSLIHQIKDLEKQVTERREWAQQKALQAARKLTRDLTELKTLRMERETQRLKNGKQTLEDSTMKRLSVMENALKKATLQVDRANAAVRKLETENAEIRADIEAAKLSASESVVTRLEIAKREKKCLKKVLALEKQKTKIQEGIALEKQKISELQQESALVEAATKDAEEKWREEQKSKELTLAQLEEERRLKEAAEADNKRILEALRVKIEIDFQRHKDDLQRLEQEYARSAEVTHRSAVAWPEKSNGAPQGETIASQLHDLDKLEEDSAEIEDSCDRECMICMKDEVSIVFLPCAHQVICANCNDNYGKSGRAMCPYCRAPVEQRIRVYGASS